MPMRAKREVHRLSGYFIEGAVWGPPPPSPHKIFFCSSSSSPPPHCLPQFEQIVGILISIHFRTVVVANSNNFQIHPVCNLLSTNEINPSENIFNNNVVQNGISKIVKSGRFSQFLRIGLGDFILKSGRLQPPYITEGIEYILPYNLAQKNCSSRPERSIHQSVRFPGGGGGGAVPPCRRQ